MSAWTADDLLKEINDLEDLYSLRPTGPTIPHLVTGLQSKIDGIDSLTPRLLVHLIKALDAAKLPEDMKKALQDTMEKRMVQMNSGPLKLQNVPQTLQSLYNYFSAKEWVQLQKAPFTESVHIAVQRLRAIGVKSVREATKKHVVALLVHLAMMRGEPKPPGGEIYKMSAYLHEAFTKSKQPSLVPGLATYPDKPADIGPVTWMHYILFIFEMIKKHKCIAGFCAYKAQEFMDACYLKDGQPSHVGPMVATTVSALLKDIPVRSTHAETRGAAAPAMKRNMSFSSTDSLAGVCMDFMQMMMATARGMDSAPLKIDYKKSFSTSGEPSAAASGRLALPSGCSQGEGTTQANGTLATIPNPALPLTDTPPEEEAHVADTVPPGHEETKNDHNEKKELSLKDYEDQAFKKLQEKQGQKTKEHKDKNKKPVLKRPAAAKAKAVAKTVAKKKGEKCAQQKVEPKDQRNPVWGCSRCRGDPFGCDACAKASFGGERLNGRAASRKWWTKHHGGK